MHPSSHRGSTVLDASAPSGAGASARCSSVVIPLVFVLFGVALALYYHLAYRYHFFWHEQNQLFLLDSEYIGHYFERPAWLACLAGDWLTQFYYYMYAGPIILVALVVVCLWLLYVCLSGMMCVRQGCMWRVLAVLLTIGAGVWIVGSTFSMFFSLSSLLCVIGGILSYCAIRRLWPWGVLLIPMVYWCFGFGCLVTAALCLLSSVFDYRRHLAASLVSLALAMLTPLALARTYTLHYDKALLYPGLAAPVWPDRNFENNLGIENEYYFGDHDRALEIAQAKDYHDDVSSFYFHLIWAKRDSLPDYLMRYGNYDVGTLHTIGETTPRPIINMMHDLYYELGDMTYAERAAMMRNVFSDQNRNVRMVKRLAEINMVSGDTLAAKKYLRLLSKTHAYRGWAARYLGPDGNMLPGWIRSTPATAVSDTLRLGDNCRTILLQALERNPDNTLALDYLLCTDLLLRDMDTFKADYDRYCMDRRRPRLRKLYQEALAIYMAGTEAPREQWQRYVLPETVRRFEDYNRHGGDPRYPGSYWRYFEERK